MSLDCEGNIPICESDHGYIRHIRLLPVSPWHRGAAATGGRLPEPAAFTHAMSPETPPGESCPGAGQAPTGGVSPQPARLSDELARLIAAFAERKVTVREAVEVMHGRGYDLLLVLLALPLCTPIPLPGVSTPFGLIIAFIGLRLALGQKPWLPTRLLDTRLPEGFFPRFLSATRRVVRWLEHFLKPRLQHLLRWRVARHGMGLVVCCSGLLLLLPLPIPFTNFLPATTVVLLSAATIEEDGCFALAGGAMFLLTLAYFAAIFWGGTEVVFWLENHFGGVLDPDYETPPPGGAWDVQE
jgi:hypothetical protein